MNDSIEERLAAATAALHKFRSTTRLAEQLRARMDAAGDELALLRNRLDDEQADVDALERPSLTRLLSSVRGGRADALARERAEMEAVRYQVGEAKARFDTVRAEHLAARDKLARLATAPAEHAAALEAKERYLAESGHPRGAALVANAELRGRLGGELREVRQALSAAGNANNYLDELRDRITKAQFASRWDARTPGSAYHSISQTVIDQLDKVAEGGVYAAEWLALLRDELADIDESMPELPDVSVRLPRFPEIQFGQRRLHYSVTQAIMTAGTNAREAMAIIDKLRTRLEARAELLARLAAAEHDRETLHAMG
ncbi:hypothetical protein ACPPVO_43685 [Dactylosporangium sp. McL0621]|uniref:hypothetical protein n=1 Tax=Dactylosporangium sp. McL0621 TaxID=3415678 RepID=UPI003CEE8B6A